MKKIKILLNIFFVCVFITCAVSFGFTIKDLLVKIDSLKELEDIIATIKNDPDYFYLVEPYTHFYKETILQIVRLSVEILLYFIIFTSSAFFFVFFNSKLIKKSTYSDFIKNSIDNRTQNKAEHKINKQKNKETKKQLKIAELEAQLQELKKEK